MKMNDKKAITRLELKDSNMPLNSHGVKTYGEWCAKEAERSNGSCRYVEVWLTKEDKIKLQKLREAKKYKAIAFLGKDECFDGSKCYCQVERV